MPLTPRMNGSNVLLLLRNKVNTWEGLCSAYGCDPDSLVSNSYTIWLSQTLAELRRLGLVRFDDDPARPGAALGSIEVQKLWPEFQLAIGGPRLADLATLGNDNDAMAVKPFFRAPKELRNAAQIFVLMPFAEEMKAVYEDHIKKVARRVGRSVARADDFFTAHALMGDIWAAICAAEIVIADCTGKNPNVFYEIGVAHTLGKDVVLITQKNEDVPVDLRHLRFIPYVYTPPGVKLFEEALERTIRATLGLEEQDKP